MTGIRAAEALAQFALAQQCIGARQYGQAVVHLRAAVALNALFPQAVATLAYLLHQVEERPDEAETWYQAALAQEPSMANVHMNYGSLLLQQKRFSEAEAAFANALQLQPARSAMWCNLGSLYLRLQREDEARTCLHKALELNPQDALARFNLSYLALRHGAYAQAWALYEARDWYLRFAQQFPFPRWEGEPLRDKALLLCLEAGHGDVLQFVRYAALLRARGPQRLSLVCHAPLVRLLRSMPELDQVYAYSEDFQPPGYDYWMPLMSAPFHFQSAQARALGDYLPEPYAPAAYLHADPALRGHWAQRLAQHPQAGGADSKPLRVGLAWQGNPKFEFDRDRSLRDVQLLLPLWDVRGVQLVSLQKGAGQEQALAFAQARPLLCLGQDMEDFADAAAIVAQLDLVISVDSAMAHLAGALGTPCWVLLPHYMTDWRWGVQGSDSVWYPQCLRLFRQGPDGDWGPVIQAVVQVLRTLARA